MLHDEIGQGLALLGINFSLLLEDLPAELRKKLAARTGNVGGLIEQASGIVRRITHAIKLTNNVFRNDNPGLFSLLTVSQGTNGCSICNIFS